MENLPEAWKIDEEIWKKCGNREKIPQCTLSYKISEEQSLGNQSSADILEYF